jgi:hypothetical protein
LTGFLHLYSPPYEWFIIWIASIPGKVFELSDKAMSAFKPGLWSRSQIL